MATSLFPSLFLDTAFILDNHYKSLLSTRNEISQLNCLWFNLPERNISHLTPSRISAKLMIEVHQFHSICELVKIIDGMFLSN